MVAGGVLERRPEEGLTAAAEKQHVRYRTASIFALQRSNVGNRCRQHRSKAFQTLEIPRETVRHGERHDGKQSRHLQIALVLKLPTRCLIDRLEVAFIAVAIAVWRNAHNAVEHTHQLLPLPKLVLNIFPLARLIADLRSEFGALRISEARRAHELEGRLGRGRLLVRVIDREQGRDRAGHTQLVDIGVANKANGVPRRPTGREISDRIAAKVETVGDDLADFRRAILKRTESAKPFGAHQNPVRIGDDLHIAAHGLIGNRIEAVIIHHVLARNGRRRGQIINELQKPDRIEDLGLDIDRTQHRRHGFAQRNQLFVADFRAFRHPERDEDAMRPKVKGRVARETRPNALLEIVGSMLCDALVDALRHLTRHEPLYHAIGDPGAHPLEDLDRRLVGNTFRQELRDNFAGLIVGADQR